MQQERHVVFCVEDTVGLKSDTSVVGVIDRCFGDVDTHLPRPQHEYHEEIQRDPDISAGAFAEFLNTGIPPRGTVLVAWQTELKTELIIETKLELLDRALYVGDVVKRNVKDHMSGTVIGTTAVCTLFPATRFTGGEITQAAATELCIGQVPVEELLNVHEFVEGTLVVYNDWVGRVENVYDEMAVKLSNNSVVVVEDPTELEREGQASADRISVGDKVKTKKGNLRRGNWRFGAFDPNVKPVGIVVEVRTSEIDVQWMARSISAVDNSRSVQEPPVTLGRDEFESPTFYKYDASGSAANTLPIAANGVDRSYHVADVAVGDHVRFKDITAATVKYNGSGTLPNGAPRGKVTKLPRTDSMGYDLNVFLVMQTHSMATVQWQDLTVTQDFATTLLPDPNVEDDDEVWPGEVIFSKEGRTSTNSSENYDRKPSKVGVVQTVNGRDRIATVRWFKDPLVEFFASDLLRPARTGELDEAIEDVSLYDIYSFPALTRRRGDFVLIHPNSIEGLETPLNVTGPDWFGEVIDLGLDGKLTVRLGAAKPVVDVKVPYEGVTLAYSSDMDDEETFNGLDGYSYSMSGESDFEEMWIEYEGMDGEAMAGDDGDWSTEEEDEDETDDDDDDDESMPDFIDPGEVETTKTTPESKSSPLTEDKAEEPTRSQELMATEDEIPTGQVASDPESTPSQPPGAPAPFAILETPTPDSHHFIKSPAIAPPTLIRRVAKEHRILATSLPPSIYVRTWESRLDLLRILIIGPIDTPYEFAPFVIDVYLPPTWPTTPPKVFFHSWTGGEGPVNPNLYEDGTICLSLLGTWHSDGKGEGWTSKSTILQVLVSLLGLVLVKEPYYNEAGYDVHRSAPETKLSSALYTERAYFRARAFIHHALTNPVEPFQQELQWLYQSRKEGAPRLLDRAVQAAREIVKRSENREDEGERDGLRKVSLGALVMLKRQLERLEELQSAAVEKERGGDELL
ncbi:hypothetical protein IAQ61_003229 [Plenodomus lingam]|uniref:UBC core domain-containing protein n=1 Tax=Leptosphaeria maculans (strain JN3 / isolate v23.1.3 / race Av1-4-5-6-7-8) TaxID=985895 RepID=E5ADW5_LEPMJ|nr:hypothetical protein LEMA_P001910.1 [Plenodomus lingam JN3]KAH9875765.1 hypothetical protein IAQ61_003229 [Plenodomus lingam]CBY01404.1 hypothetical protein LEMA_P001910.1 [Plenodomus lingam JN3]